MSKITQFVVDSFKFDGYPLPLAILSVGIEEIANKLGLNIEEWEDDLAPRKGFVIKLPNKLFILFQQNEHLIANGTAKGPTIEIDSYGVDFKALDQTAVAEDFKGILNYILENIGLTLNDVQTRRIDAENWSCGFKG